MTHSNKTANVFTRFMSMNDKTWRRHANPWSVWTRVVTGVPVVFSAIWSINVLGIWSFPILATSIAWLWLNPRLFPVPKNTNNWASKVTFGERVWLNRSNIKIPEHHLKRITPLLVATGVGFAVGIVGAYYHLVLPMVLGGVISWFAKMWFCDRMVWLYEDMKEGHAEYASWLKEG